jgi:DNA-binding NtrC family response regulator
LFLDEIATASEDLQVKFLRVLENGRFERVGDTSTRSSEARIVTASNRDLAREVAEGRFREDLYYRIDVVRVDVPPLRERPSDVPLLARTFVAELADEHRRPARGVAPEAMALLVAHPWPGNVRQLRHALERAVLLAPGNELVPADLGPELTRAREAGPEADPGARGAEPHADLPLGSLKRALEGPERRLILRTLEHTRGNRKQTAALLEINRSTLFNKMRKYKLLSFPTSARPPDSAEEPSDAA